MFARTRRRIEGFDRATRARAPPASPRAASDTTPSRPEHSRARDGNARRTGRCARRRRPVDVPKGLVAPGHGTATQALRHSGELAPRRTPPPLKIEGSWRSTLRLGGVRALACAANFLDGAVNCGATGEARVQRRPGRGCGRERYADEPMTPRVPGTMSALPSCRRSRPSPASGSIQRASWGRRAPARASDPPHGRLPAHASFSFWDAAIRVSGDPAIGLEVGERLRTGALGSFEYLLRNSETV